MGIGNTGGALLLVRPARHISPIVCLEESKDFPNELIKFLVSGRGTACSVNALAVGGPGSIRICGEVHGSKHLAFRRPEGRLADAAMFGGSQQGLDDATQEGIFSEMPVTSNAPCLPRVSAR